MSSQDHQDYHAPTTAREWWNSNKKVISIVIIVLVIASLSIFAYISYSGYQNERRGQVFAFYNVVATSSNELTVSLYYTDNNGSSTSIQMLGASSVLIDDVYNNYLYISDDYSQFLSSTMSDRSFIASTLIFIADKVHNGTITNNDKNFISNCANATWYLELSLVSVRGPPSLLEQFTIANLATNINNFHTLYSEALEIQGYA